MAELFRKKQNTDPSAVDMNRPIRVVPSMYWLIYVGGVLIVLAVLAWMCFGWTIETANMTGLYHPNAAKDGEILCFPPLNIAKTIQPGMEMTAYVASYNQQEYGHIEGTVSYVDPYVTSVNEMKALLGDDMLVNVFLQNGPVAVVVCKLDEDASSENGYKWSSEEGGSLVIQDGTYMSVSVAVSKEKPFALGLPILYELFS